MVTEVVFLAWLHWHLLALQQACAVVAPSLFMQAHAIPTLRLNMHSRIKTGYCPQAKLLIIAQSQA
jgi:hypothetical protein